MRTFAWCAVAISFVLFLIYLDELLREPAPKLFKDEIVSYVPWK